MFERTRQDQRQSDRNHHDVHRSRKARDRSGRAHQRPRQQTAENCAILHRNTPTSHRRVQLENHTDQTDHQVRAQTPRRPRQDSARRNQTASY